MSGCWVSAAQCTHSLSLYILPISSKLDYIINKLIYDVLKQTILCDKYSYKYIIKLMIINI